MANEQYNNPADRSSAYSDSEHSLSSTSSSSEIPISNPAHSPELDDVRIEYHPLSGRLPDTAPIYEIRRDGQVPETTPPASSATTTPSWSQGFATQLDFEIAEFTLDAQLNKRQIKTLLDLLQRTARCPADLTYNSVADIDRCWEAASHQFTCTPIAVKHRGHEGTFDFHHTSVWDWIRNLVTDPALAPHFVWDAQRIYKHNGQQWVRFYDEPWTGNRMWDIQSTLATAEDPAAAKPLGLILYADKSKLSSFGTASAFPIVMRLANIVAPIRNSEKYGGGWIAGWLPIASEDSAQSGKRTYVEYKNVIWHEAMACLLAFIQDLSRTGINLMCGDGIQRLLCIFILILAADFEEQTTMALTRGTNANYPCPRCLVPADSLADLLSRYDMRTASAMQALVSQAAGLDADGAEELLKAHGLRGITNAFWGLANSDPYAALSYDTLHSAASGVFAHHLWGQLKRHIELLGRSAIAKVDECMAQMPRWSGLTHFDSVMKITFNDGTKHADLSRVRLLCYQQIMFAVHTVLTEDVSPSGYALLRALRWYLEVFAFIDLSVHTQDTLSGKSWDFPKMHLLVHVFDDIVAKGATLNYSTKPFEKLHGPLRKIYLNQTNFKDIFKILHRHYVAQLIRDRMPSQYEDEEDNKQKEKISHTFAGRIHLGSPDAKITFAELEGTMGTGGPDAIAFSRFRLDLTAFLHMHALPGSAPIILKPHDTVSGHILYSIPPFKYLRVDFLSEVDWRLTENKLRSNPSFYQRPRYDFIQLKHPATGKLLVGQIRYLFVCEAGGEVQPLVLVRCLDGAIGQRSKKDKELGFVRLRVRPRRPGMKNPSSRHEFEIFPLDCVVRGVVVAPAHDRDSDYLLVNYADEDLFIRTLPQVPVPTVSL
ncbi:hypothetical protein HDZ31DRAFT_35978 [Schizophyllum fasciatum]